MLFDSTSQVSALAKCVFQDIPSCSVFMATKNTVTTTCSKYRRYST